MGLVIENGVLEFLYVSLLVFWIIYLYFVKDYGYWEQRNVPHVPAVFPFGSMSQIVLGSCYLGTTIDKIYNDFKNERYVGFVDVRKPGLLIRDPELIRHILQKDFYHFMDHPWCEAHPSDYMLNHLFNLKGKDWKEMRMQLTPAYTTAKMKIMFCLMKSCSDVLRDSLTEMTKVNNVIDVKDLLSRFTMDTIGTCAFGLEVNSLSNNNSQFYYIVKQVFELNFAVLMKMYLYNAFPMFSKLHCFDFFDTKIRDFFTNLIRSTVEYREKFNVNRNDFLDLLIKLRQNQSILEEGEQPPDLHMSSKPEKRKGLTIEDMTAETFLFLVAGYESTSNTIMYCLYELACNSEIQERLHSEVEEVLSKHQTICYQALKDMTYMDQVINESMRRHPVFPILFRICTENYRIPNSTLVIKKGLRIIIPVCSLHHDPTYFLDPYTFDPERFNKENMRERHPLVFLPFGEGPRMCIGYRFGLMQVKTALATLLADYIISVTPDTDVPLKMKNHTFITLPAKPITLAFTMRHPAS